MKRAYTLFTLIFLLLVSMSFVSVVSAADVTTMVNLRTDDYLKSIFIKFKDPSMNGAIFDSKSVKTDAIGRATFEFDTSRSSIQFLLLYVENGEVAKDILTDSYDTGGAIEIDLRSGEELRVESDPSVEETNETEEEEEIAVVETEEVITPGILDKTISGFAIAKDKIVSINSLYYYILGIVILGAFVLVFIMKHKEPSKDPDVQFKENESKTVSHAEKRLDELEKQLQEARQELGVAKVKEEREEKIQEMKEKLKRDKEKLHNLKHE